MSYCARATALECTVGVDIRAGGEENRSLLWRKSAKQEWDLFVESESSSPSPPIAIVTTTSSGVILTAVADLDRETQDRYELVVTATDMAGQLGGLSGSTTVTIVITDVNDNPPRFPQSE